MRPSTLHRFHHITAGVRLELTWNPPVTHRKPWLRRVLSRIAFGGPDPASPAIVVPQKAFDRALDLLNAGPAQLPEAEAAFRKLGYSVDRLEVAAHVPA